jgi:hypothetical protein
MKHSIYVVVVALVICLGTIWGQTAAKQETEPWWGTWRMDVSKAVYSPGPAPKGQVVTLPPSNKGGIKLIIENISLEGETGRVELEGKLDGKDYPVKGNPAADTYAYRLLDNRSFERVAKKNGKVTTTMKVVVSPDGKIMTTTTTGTNPQGQTIHNEAVFVRQ